MRRFFWITTVLIISTTFATASNMKPVKAEEPTLVSILQELGFTNIEESSNETFVSAGTYNITLYAEFAGYHESNNLSWYLVGTSEYNLIFSGPEGNYGYINPPLSKIFAVNGVFGLSFHSPEARYFTETSRNPDGIKHAKIYINLDNPDMYLIGFENMLGGGDGDYNDMVISLEFVSQPVEIAGVDWYITNTTSDKIMVYLDGGWTYPGASFVFIYGWDADKTTEEANFLSKMVSGGVDVIFNKNAFSYDGSETIVKDTATWLLNTGYERAFLFGWSGGGVVVAYEVQKEYASKSYSAAISSSAPVDWDSFSDAPIFQSAHTAEKDKVATCFIEGEGDMFSDQMLLYFDNAIVDKEWHTWNGEHNIFLNICKDHLGEDVATATVNWFNAEHPPNIPSTPYGATYVVVGTTYSYSTSTTDPNGDDVRYEFDWGDGTTTTTGWYASGATATASHSWSASGEYGVEVRAQDTKLQWSNWSSSLKVTVEKPSGGPGCPTLFVWNGTIYSEEGLLNIHNPEGIDVVTNHTLVTTPHRVNGAYLMRLTEHPQTHSYIDEVKLYATIENGTTIELPLIWANHSEYGNVLPQLLFSDEWKTETLGADHNNGTSQSIDLKFAALSPHLEIVAFTFQIEGNNPHWKK